MKYRMRWRDSVCAVIAVSAAQHASSNALAESPEVELIEIPDRDAWISAVGGPGAFTTLDFTGLQQGMLLSDQYLHLGALFVDDDDFVGWFPHWRGDQWGLFSWDQFARLEFCEPQRFIAADFPANARFTLYQQGEAVGFAASSWFSNGFGGVISSVPFDRAIIWDIDGISLDNIHFGRFPPVVGDATFDSVVNVDDLIEVIVNWGECAVPADACPVPQCSHADLNDDGKVDVDDLIEVLVSWTAGSRPPG